jgi:hypothetical protein
LQARAADQHDIIDSVLSGRDRETNLSDNGMDSSAEVCFLLNDVPFGKHGRMLKGFLPYF